MNFFEGRSSRFTFFLVVIGIIVAATIFCALASSNLPDIIASILTISFVVGINFLSFGYGIRRLHDIDKSGWWFLFSFVPLLNIALAITLLFWPGTKGDNRFGPPPA
jgi:uncharacterized membrane protein YhaH (DUF805 family)